MPPARTTPTVVKKTERTHEENQERAYIAASRRSDRSLEARVESARRASEIHKKRTGRSLRITEQDVINEEMYEEEDDDLPLHYRLLQHQLRTDSAEFNRRYLAYMTSQLSVRSALDQAYAKYFPNYNNVVNGGNESAMFLNPLAAQPLRSPPAQVTAFPGSPYPLPRRSSSHSTVKASGSQDGAAEMTSPKSESRSSVSKPTSPVVGAAPGSKSLSGPPFFPYRPPFQMPHDQQEQLAALMARQQPQKSSQSAPESDEMSDSPSVATNNPFSMNLPPATQQFFSFVDPSDPFTAAMLGTKQDGDAMFTSPDSESSHPFGDSVPVFPPETADAALSPKTTLHKEQSEKSEDLDGNIFDETAQDDNWNLFMNEWESVNGSQG